MKEIIQVIGGGLAGCEAAWQIGRRGIPVRLYEMRPMRSTEAHRTGLLAELVCSNSLRSKSLSAAVGLLKEELRLMGSIVLESALASEVPAGQALAVDRDAFSRLVTQRVRDLDTIELVIEEVCEIPEGVVIVATGPLTSGSLSESIGAIVGRDLLYFYDAISPILTADSVDTTVAFRASRYGKGDEDYLNIPLDREQYEGFVEALLAAEKVPAKNFEKMVVFEGCMPIEEMAARGRESLRFGPMKPVGLVDPRSGRSPYAALQLRQDNSEGTLYNMVGFQTKMTYPEQRRIFKMLPGLEQAQFVRLGSLHRNTFLESPRLLLPTLQWRERGNLFFAGQMTGVEGYVESAATGLLAGLNAARLALGLLPCQPPRTTALGALVHYISDPERKNFQPMNANYGLFPGLDKDGRMRKKDKRMLLAGRALREMEAWFQTSDPFAGSDGQRAAGDH